MNLRIAIALRLRFFLSGMACRFLGIVGRRWWIHPINQGRPNKGEFHTLYPQLREHPDRFKEYLRMTPDQFDELCLRLQKRLIDFSNFFLLFV
jgi:hypothetical protein